MEMSGIPGSGQMSLLNSPSNIRHAHQSSLREWHVEQRRARRESGAQPDLLRQKKWSHGPELIHRKNERKYLEELLAQELVGESYCGEQIAAQRNSNSRGHHHGREQHCCSPSRKKRISNIVYRVQTKKCNQVKDQVHRLNQSEQSARKTATGHRNFELRMEKPCRHIFAGRDFRVASLAMRLRLLHWREETISSPCQRLDIPGTGCRIAQGLPQLVHCGVQAVVEIHESVGRPELLAQLLARDHIAGTLPQQGQDW